MATDDALRECLDQWRQGQPMTAHDDRLLTAALDDRAALAAALRRAVGQAIETNGSAFRNRRQPWTWAFVPGSPLLQHCTFCGASGRLAAALPHAADCLVAVLARHDAARVEGTDGDARD